MKALLFTLPAVLAFLATPEAPPSQDDPRPPSPIECPLCGGNASLHNRVLSDLAVIQARVGLRHFDAIF